MKKENKSDLNIKQSVNKQSNNIRLSRRQLVKKRKSDRLIEKSKDMKIFFSINTEHLKNIVTSKILLKSDGLSNYVTRHMINNIKISILYGKEYLKCCETINSLLTSSVIRNEDKKSYYEIKDVFFQNDGKHVVKEIVEFSNKVEIIKKLAKPAGSSFITKIRVKSKQLNIHAVKKISDTKTENVNLFVDRTIFREKIISLFKDIVNYLRDKVKELEKTGFLSNDFAKKKDLIICGFLHDSVYFGNILTVNGYNRIKDRSPLFKNVVNSIGKDFISGYSNINKENSIYRLEYRFKDYGGSRKIIHFKIAKFDNFLKEILDISEYKDRRGNLKKEYYPYVSKRFINSIKRGVI